MECVKDGSFEKSFMMGVFTKHYGITMRRGAALRAAGKKKCERVECNITFCQRYKMRLSKQKQAQNAGSHRATVPRYISRSSVF
jgi:hypothetical protein